jgi:heat-inducible transcriptional repressor
MTDKPAPPKLGNRQVEVLRSIIREHILTGEPIGSRTVAGAARLELSSASIRNIMAELEERGLLAQPHTSAGRVPTDQAYRLYVDQMIRKPRVAAAQAQEIDRALGRMRGEIADLLAEASRQLSHFSNQVGLVLAPDLQRIIVEHLEFVRLDARRVVVVIVGRSGVVHNRILRVDESLEQSDFERIGRYLSAEFGGHTLPEMRRLLRERIREERAAYDRLMAKCLELAQQALDAAELEGAVFVQGASNLLDSPEFADVDEARALFKTLEENRTLVDLLSRLLDESGVQVVIGEENPTTNLARCSLVASAYGAGERVMGTVGIVGPTRMEYARAIALVDYQAQVLSRLLSAGGH